MFNGEGFVMDDVFGGLFYNNIVFVQLRNMNGINFFN